MFFYVDPDQVSHWTPEDGLVDMCMIAGVLPILDLESVAQLADEFPKTIYFEADLVPIEEPRYTYGDFPILVPLVEPLDIYGDFPIIDGSGRGIGYFRTFQTETEVRALFQPYVPKAPTDAEIEEAYEINKGVRRIYRSMRIGRAGLADALDAAKFDAKFNTDDD